MVDLISSANKLISSLRSARQPTGATDPNTTHFLTISALSYQKFVSPQRGLSQRRTGWR